MKNLINQPETIRYAAFILFVIIAMIPAAIIVKLKNANTLQK